MNDKDKIIASLRKQLEEQVKKNRALEQEVALLEYKIIQQESQKNNTYGLPVD